MTKPLEHIASKYKGHSRELDALIDRLSELDFEIIESDGSSSDDESQFWNQAVDQE